MAIVPIDKALQKQYRDSLVVPSAPAMIDSDVPVTPVAVINPPSGPVNVAIKQKGVLRSSENVLEVTATGSKNITITVPNGKRWQPKHAFCYGDSGWVTNYWEFNLIADQAVGNIILKTGTDDIGGTNILTNLEDWNFQMGQGQQLQFKATVSSFTSTGDMFFFLLFQEWDEDQ